MELRIGRRTSLLFHFLTALAAVNIAWLISDETPQILGMRRFRIVIALVISAVAAWSRRVVGSAISFMALSWIAFEYLMWWRISRIVVVASGSDFSRTPNLLHLINARWWDLGMLLLTVVAVIWCGTYFVRQLTLARNQS